MTPATLQSGGVRVAVEGCGHGTLNAIYAAVERSCKERKWDTVDLLIIGGDLQVRNTLLLQSIGSFETRLADSRQSVRHAQDLAVMACPVKYRELGDFPDYYSGVRKAPYVTIFIGGNHEASSHLWELFYGGWVAPNIYYMGAANVLRFGPLRIAGMSGIWKGFDYRKPHFERLPFSDSDVRSFYHVREIDVRKLLLLRTQVDIGLSHDWPRGIEKHGDSERLFRQKRDFRQESIDGTLGNVAAEYVLDRLRPPYWFSAHLHVKFAALKSFSAQRQLDSKQQEQPHTEEAVAEPPQEANPDEIDLDLDDADDDATGVRAHTKESVTKTPQEANPDEIDLGLDDGDDNDDNDVPVQPQNGTAPAPKVQEISEDESRETNKVSEELLAQLPASFAKPPPRPKGTPGQPVPPGITNTQVRFLALDKCLPGRRFLQLCEVHPFDKEESVRYPASESSPRYRLEYDPEWLAITRVFHRELVIGDPASRVSADLGEAEYIPLIDRERQWVEDNIVKAGKLAVPENFSQTAPPYEQGTPGILHDQPDEYTNPQTAEFCLAVGSMAAVEDVVEGVAEVAEVDEEVDAVGEEGVDSVEDGNGT
ncbi:hypothetical protein LLEC1_03047 [Akanthomyces lecanii]|uniref:Lariat debranching enzyme C-terminal domain-containing protein n=1 Tax=Cordyceps confragosa TaxID=2714763 RepID=A0A179IC18_CORDF|nr:hypothetical protein LLEC1_03047 [Akanthomyces lecanii]